MMNEIKQQDGEEIRKKQPAAAWLRPLALLGCFIIVATMGNCCRLSDHLARKPPLNHHNTTTDAAKSSTTTGMVVAVPNQEDFDYCRSKNRVLPRNDKMNHGHKDPHRPFSLNALDYAPFQDDATTTTGTSLPLCTSPQQVEDSLEYGQRQWDNATHADWGPRKREKFGSHFVPSGCRIQTFASNDICNVLNDYSQVVLMGDSLIRHLRQTIYMSLTNDYVKGGIITSNETKLDECQCDGQFSENLDCRQDIDELYFGHLTSPPQEGYCTHLSKDDQPPFQLLSEPDWDQLQCEEDSKMDSRPMLLVLQGGPHQDSDPQRYYQEIVQPLLNNTNFQRCHALGKIHVIHISYTAQSRSLDRRFAHQTREKAILFNEYMKKTLQHSSTNAIPYHQLNWWNLTKDAQTSDGFHFLMDVNVIMAQYLFNLAHQLTLSNNGAAAAASATTI